MRAGTAKVDITPQKKVWMDGMLRPHRSLGVHDPLFARAFVLDNNDDRSQAFTVVFVDVCGLREKDVLALRQTAASRTGLPENRMVIATIHTHSGPATMGFGSSVEEEYVQELMGKLVTFIETAAGKMRAVAVGCASGREDTISHYRRLLADDGRVVMNWEPLSA